MVNINAAIFGITALCISSGFAKTVKLEDLEITNIRQGWGQAQAGRCVAGGPLTLKGRKYENGLGTHTSAEINIKLDGKATRLQALAGIDDDTRGKQARIVRKNDRDFVMAKELEDGSLAVGLFNIDEEPQTVTASWQELGISGKRRVRDLWRQKDEDLTADGQYSAKIPRHGVKLIRFIPLDVK